MSDQVTCTEIYFSGFNDGKEFGATLTFKSVKPKPPFFNNDTERNHYNLGFEKGLMVAMRR